MIKQNESELANTVFKIQPNKTDIFFCFLLFVQSFNCLYLWNQLPNLCGVFTKLKPLNNIPIENAKNKREGKTNNNNNNNNNKNNKKQTNKNKQTNKPTNKQKKQNKTKNQTKTKQNKNKNKTNWEFFLGHTLLCPIILQFPNWGPGHDCSNCELCLNPTRASVLRPRVKRWRSRCFSCF